MPKNNVTEQNYVSYQGFWVEKQTNGSGKTRSPKEKVSLWDSENVA